MREISAYQHRGARAIKQLIERAPSTGGLALWMAHENVHSDQHAPPVTCDGVKVYYRASFEYLTIRQQMGLVAHEVLHVALRHAQRLTALQEKLGNVDCELFNICADAVVNSALAEADWLELPAGSVFLDRLLMDVLGIRQEAGTALREWDVERLYRAIDDRDQPRAPGVKTGQGRNGGRDKGETQRKDSQHQTASGRETDRVLHRDGPLSARTRHIGARIHRDLIAAAPGTADQEQTEAEEAQAWIYRVRQASVADGECTIMRGLIAGLRFPRTPWEHVLRTRLARALAPKSSMSWSRPARSYLANQGRSRAGRRLPWEPGTSQSALVPRVALLIDVSGSIGEQLLKQFTKEIEIIVRRQAAGLILIVGDDRVRKTVVFESGRAALDDLEFAGGGGTDFSPLLAEATRHNPDIGIIFTDLDGPAGPSPPFPVVWAVPAVRAQSVPPFGQILVLE